jgi:hypothetical protein
MPELRNDLFGVTIHPRLLALFARTPELQPYRKHLVGCCRKENDRVMVGRIGGFLTWAPQFESLLRPLLKGFDDPR